MSLILLRHGSTQLNEAGELRGWIDVPLSALGQEQALCAAEQLADIKIARIFSSDLHRASETGRVVARKNAGQTVELSETLRPINFGDLQGRPYTEIEGSMKDLFKNWQANPDVRAPNGESFATFQDRAYAALGLLSYYASIASARKECILAVTHTRVCSYAMAVCMNKGRKLEGRALELLDVAEVGPGNIVEIQDGRIQKMNCLEQKDERPAEPAYEGS